MHRLSPRQEALTPEDLEALTALRRRCAGDILLSTTLAGCGHPGGSLSTLDALLVLYATLDVDPQQPLDPERDRVFVSHGHVSPCVYSVLAAADFVSREDFLLGFRRAGNRFGGHVETLVPGVEWCTGNLGQGLSAGVGSAIGVRRRGSSASVVVCMGDGEQQKGQISEARRTAVKFGLDNLLAIVDLNLLQIGGATDDVMPIDVGAGYAADGWNVLEIDGHDHGQLFGALRRFQRRDLDQPHRPTVILARTVMGKGIPFMENDSKWHGQALKDDACSEALAHLQLDPGELDALRAAREALQAPFEHAPIPEAPQPDLEIPPPTVYGLDTKTDCRSAYGKVMEGLARANNLGRVPKVMAFSCDLEGSVKLGALRKLNPDAFFECGIQEHSTVVTAGRLSREGYRVFFSTFGMFAVTEVFNQLRLNDYNGAHLKVVCTHCGLDVGEDGPTHQCLDYVGLLSNTFGFEIFVPADPNQCDRIVRHVAGKTGNSFVAMGRSKMPPLTRADGSLMYDETTEFVPGKADVVREGSDGAILAYGATVAAAVAAHEQLMADGVNVAVVNMASIKPLDREAVVLAAATGRVLTAEDHHADTGLGSLVAQVLAEEGLSVRFARAGVEGFCTSGKPADLYAMNGLDGAGLATRFRGLLG